jgi:S1-C subfamily serine protease
VQKSSPAAKAGIHGCVAAGSEQGEVSVGGDIIVGIDGKTVNSSEDLSADIGAKKPGDVIKVKVLHPNGHGGWETKTLSVTLGSRPSSNPFPSNNNTPEG